MYDNTLYVKNDIHFTLYLINQIFFSVNKPIRPYWNNNNIRVVMFFLKRFTLNRFLAYILRNLCFVPIKIIFIGDAAECRIYNMIL